MTMQLLAATKKVLLMSNHCERGRFYFRFGEHTPACLWLKLRNFRENNEVSEYLVSPEILEVSTVFAYP